MKKYSIAWKNSQMDLHSGWYQIHKKEGFVKEIFWHWIAYNTEYSQRTGNATLKEALKNH